MKITEVFASGSFFVLTAVSDEASKNLWFTFRKKKTPPSVISHTCIKLTC